MATRCVSRNGPRRSWGSFGSWPLVCHASCFLWLERTQRGTHQPAVPREGNADSSIWPIRDMWHEWEINLCFHKPPEFLTTAEASTPAHSDWHHVDRRHGDKKQHPAFRESPQPLSPLAGMCRLYDGCDGGRMNSIEKSFSHVTDTLSNPQAMEPHWGFFNEGRQKQICFIKCAEAAHADALQVIQRRVSGLIQRAAVGTEESSGFQGPPEGRS